jgi:glycerol-3-phosphate acyltransferase PlsX
MSDHAVEAVRRKKDSSVNRAVDLVKKGDADAVVSAGHTGAMVASCTIKLRNLAGVERPGIASYLPTEHNVCVLIDAGANVDARPIHMLQYAIMGAVVSELVLGQKNPSIGLMSIGGEDQKGNEFTKEIFKLLRASKLNFRGNVEGHDLFMNPVEVVLCDGFTGNVVLKTCEATASAVFSWLRRELTANPKRKAGALLAQNAFRAIRDKTNYETYGGSPLVGVDGVAIIAHGASSPLAIKNAIRVACELTEKKINPRIVEAIAQFNE